MYKELFEMILVSLANRNRISRECKRKATRRAATILAVNLVDGAGNDIAQAEAAQDNEDQAMPLN